MESQLKAVAGTKDAAQNAPLGLHIELVVNDPDVIDQLCRYPEGDPRDHFALDALRIGVLALRQARGELDSGAVRAEGERLMQQLQRQLDQHSQVIHTRVSDVLGDYFDPQSGRFQDRIERLIRKDGELESLLRRQIGQEDSELCQTLARHFGLESPLMKTLDPEQSKGLLSTLRATLEQQLNEQREHVLEQFSLDNKQGALSRLVGELTEKHGELTAALRGKLDDVVKQFSLDEEGSALCRLIRSVEHSQETITSEFSLDEDHSALARLKRELSRLLEEQNQRAARFQEEVKLALHKLTARKEQSQRSTRHGLEFEDALAQWLCEEAHPTGDLLQRTGNHPGEIQRSKVGDFVLELGPDSLAGGARIVIEAKEKERYSVNDARNEMDTARKNRRAAFGIFVFSSQSAPAELAFPVQRIGQDVFCTWDPEDAQTDVHLRCALTIAKALVIQQNQASSSSSVSTRLIEQSVLRLEKRIARIGQMQTWTKTIFSNSQKIGRELGRTRDELREQLKQLQDFLAEFGDMQKSSRQATS